MQTTKFNTRNFIERKKFGKIHTEEEIKNFVDSVTKKEIPDYQISAWLMAAYIKGLNPKETYYLTNYMLNSGFKFKFEDKKVIDKHSTGGVGDKTSFILGPIAAACGVKVPMVAGRALGHTGGTVDKIEAFPNINTNISKENFQKLLHKNGIVLIGQTKDIAPADKKFYSLRDVTSTIESIPLITASIMSKKLAEGTSGLVFDVKYGSGAFMKTKEEAIALAKSLINVCNYSSKNVYALITDMNQPLGHAIGNSLEIVECIEVLKGKGPKDISDLSIDLAAYMVVLAGIKTNYKEAKNLVLEKIANGEALNKFKELIKSLNGDIKVFDDYLKLPTAQKITKILAPKNGTIESFKCEQLGYLVTDLGGGRKQADDKLDYGVGLKIFCKIGNKVKKGDVIGEIHYNKNQLKLANKLVDELFSNEIIKISNKKDIKIEKLVYKVLKGKNNGL